MVAFDLANNYPIIIGVLLLIVLILGWKWWNDKALCDVVYKIMDKVKDMLGNFRCTINGDQVSCKRSFANLGKKFSLQDAVDTIVRTMISDMSIINPEEQRYQQQMPPQQMPSQTSQMPSQMPPQMPPSMSQMPSPAPSGGGVDSGGLGQTASLGGNVNFGGLQGAGGFGGGQASMGGGEGGQAPQGGFGGGGYKRPPQKGGKDRPSHGH